jgi:hypothetical protein
MPYVGFRTVGRENEMPHRLRSRIVRIIGCAIVLLVVAVPLHALADEPLIEGAAVASPTLTDVVEPTTEVVEDVADDVGEAAGGAVDDVGDAAADVVDEAPTIEGPGEAAGNAAGGAQGDASAAANEVTQNGGSATGAIAPHSDGATTTTAGSSGASEGHHVRPDAERVSTASTGSSWRRTHFARLGMAVPTASFVYQPMTLPSDPAGEPEVDPCEEDPGLACLGLLFGIGEFADAGRDVLGFFLAATGVAVRGLIFLAFALLLAGIVALSVAPKRAANAGTG